MSGYGARELANAFRTVRKNTVQIAEEIPEDRYDFVAAPGVRSVSALLRHIIVAPTLYEDMHGVRRVTTLKGYDFGEMIGRMAAEEQQPRSRTEIIARLTGEGERLAAWLESLSPEFLAEEYSDVTGHTKRTRLEGLLSIKEHEMHHRGQLMLIQRLLGLVPHLTREREARQQQRATAAATAR